MGRIRRKSLRFELPLSSCISLFRFELQIFCFQDTIITIFFYVETVGGIQKRTGNETYSPLHFRHVILYRRSITKFKLNVRSELQSDCLKTMMMAWTRKWWVCRLQMHTEKMRWWVEFNLRNSNLVNWTRGERPRKENVRRNRSQEFMV